MLAGFEAPHGQVANTRLHRRVNRGADILLRAGRNLKTLYPDMRILAILAASAFFGGLILSERIPD